MNRYQYLLALTASMGLFCASGASCPRLVPQYQDPLPRVLGPSPTLEQVIQAVNANSEQIQSFSSTRATLTGQGFPTLRAMVAFERPRRFRLRAETALTGPEVDLGSNDELFWFWVRRNQPPGLFYCRHDQFVACPARQTLAVDPDWLIEALGVVQFDPRLPHQGPFPLPGDRIEVRTIQETACGPQMRVVVIDAIRAAVLQQRIYDAQGRLLASADATAHRRDPLTGLVMPTLVTVQSLPAQLQLRIDLGTVEVNRLGENAAGYWMVPNYPGYAAVDLCDPRLPQPSYAPPPVQAPARAENPAWYRPRR